MGEKTYAQIQLAALPFSSHKASEKLMWSRFTIQIWKEVRREFKLPIATSSLSSIGFIRDQLDSVFKGWMKSGLRYVHQLFQSSQFKSFEQLREEFGLPRTDFFRYLQIRHLFSVATSCKTNKQRGL